MSSVNARADTASQVVPSAVSSVGSLVERLAAEVAAARERVRLLQVQAAEEFINHEQRFASFVNLADRIHSILLPRLETFKNVDVFKDITQIANVEGQNLDERAHSRTTKLFIPLSDACPAKVQLTFRLGHDGSVDNAILDYQLEILPIFFKFDSHDQFIVPISNPQEERIAGWIDNKLVEFTRIFFELQFHDQYQQKHLETDYVMHIRFPKVNAAGQKEFDGHIYYFYTRESLQAFEADPSAYVPSG